MHRMRSHWGAASTELAALIVEHPTAKSYTLIAAAAEQIRAAATWVEEHEPSDDPRGGLAFMAGSLGERAAELGRAAEHHDPVAVAQAAGRVTAACALCHQAHRWNEGAPVSRR
jgi:hypothetical protein